MHQLLSKYCCGGMHSTEKPIHITTTSRESHNVSNHPEPDGFFSTLGDAKIKLSSMFENAVFCEEKPRRLADFSQDMASMPCSNYNLKQNICLQSSNMLLYENMRYTPPDVTHLIWIISVNISIEQNQAKWNTSRLERLRCSNTMRENRGNLLNLVLIRNIICQLRWR